MKRIGLLWGAISTVGKTAIAIVFVLVAIAAYHLYTLPLPPIFQVPHRSALTIIAAEGTTIAFRGASRGHPVNLEEMPQHLIDAVLTMEDRRFFEHGGVDLRGLLRAALANFDAGEIVQGGSTITQQLARMEFLSADQTLSRKIQEALIALWLERHLSKQEILARYLNTIYLGAGAYGVDAAARRYFEKAASQVSLAEAAVLAGLIPAPSRNAPSTSPEAARRRAALVLDAMAEVEAIPSAAAEEAKVRLPDLAVPPAERAGFGYIADWAALEARERLDKTTGNFRVLTTIDPALQRLATETVQSWLRDEGANASATQAALVAMRPDGSVLAMVGGVDYAASQFNRAVQAHRQPGSAFKLFVYLAALEAGHDPESPIDDAPIHIGNWSPQNYGRRFRGMTTLRTAFSQSINAASVRLQERVGRERVIEVAKAMGLTSQLDPNPSLALGTNEVTLLELTAAYAAVQVGRRPVKPRIVRTVESFGGARLTMDQRAEVEGLPQREAMLSMLREVVRSGTGKAAALSVPSYGKTGTTQGYRDAWFVGFAGDLVVGVWVGNDDQSSMEDVTGGRLPARIWHAFMAEALVLSRSQGEVADQQPVEPPSEPTAGPRDLLAGRADVINTATLQLGHRRVRLEGVKGIGGRAARDMAQYIGRREVSCWPTGGERYRCEVDGWDLSEVVLYNGGGQATAAAPTHLIEAERKARAAGRGIWDR